MAQATRRFLGSPPAADDTSDTTNLPVLIFTQFVYAAVYPTQRN